jgi:hypothetical protein
MRFAGVGAVRERGLVSASVDTFFIVAVWPLDAVGATDVARSKWDETRVDV